MKVIVFNDIFIFCDVHLTFRFIFLQVIWSIFGDIKIVLYFGHAVGVAGKGS